MRGYLRLFRPYTLLAPVFGGVLFSALALKSQFLSRIDLVLLNGFLMACANAASNVLNQIHDREIDADHPKKRYRPIPSGEVTMDEALSLVYVLTVFTIAVSYSVFGPIYGTLMSAILVFAWLYSSPPFRLKRYLLLNNLAIATPRGGLGIITAYSAFGNPLSSEILIPALAFAVYVFGANTFKDFDDMEADAKHGIRTLPVVLGRRGASLVTVPFLLAPFWILIMLDVGNSLNLFALPTTIAMIAVIAGDPELRGKGELMWRLFYLNYVLMMLGYVIPKLWV
ncbi:MAG: UbiA family prenyltransferase [Nitrososphaerota archaeon]